MWNIKCLWLLALLSFCQDVRSEMLLSEEGNFDGYYVETSIINPFHSSYMGCYKKGGNDIGFDHVFDVTSLLSIDACVDKCRRKGYTFAGLQRKQCMCGDHYYSVASNDCVNDKVTFCARNPKQVCGGENGVTSVYRVCAYKWYGLQCDRHCMDCDNGCHMNGTCILGCGPGQHKQYQIYKYDVFAAKYCHTGCVYGTYGPDCEQRNPYCKDGKVHPISGYCIHGCVDPQDSWGIYCIPRRTTTRIHKITMSLMSVDTSGYVCPICEHCVNPHCSGSVLYWGCPSVWTGQQCEGCVQGYWGERCNQKCSPNCKDFMCKQQNGYCEEAAPRMMFHPALFEESTEPNSTNLTTILTTAKDKKIVPVTNAPTTLRISDGEIALMVIAILLFLGIIVVFVILLMLRYGICKRKIFKHCNICKEQEGFRLWHVAVVTPLKQGDPKSYEQSPGSLTQEETTYQK